MDEPPISGPHGIVGSVESVTLTLTVQTANWNRHVDSTAASVPGLVPVVKGNGYGFGRAWLANRAATLSPVMAVGSIHEVADVPSNYTAVVLTPALKFPFALRSNAIVTIGSMDHITALSQAPDSQLRPGQQVIVKIRSSMQRYGVNPHDAPGLINACHEADLRVMGLSIHPPLHGTSSEHRQEVETLLAATDSANVDPELPVWISHVNTDDYNSLREQFPHRPWHLRMGTALWHGDKSMLSLQADVLDIQEVAAGSVVGYHGTAIDRDGHLVLVGCGSAHGVTFLADGRSPFHFQRRRLELIEAPHMHTSMCFIPLTDEIPRVGDGIDVQRPLTQTVADCIHWS